MMIFDCDYVTNLVEKWKITRDPKLLELILDQSSSLIEAIVSGYDSYYREELIQEASLRVQYALPYFNKELANLHTYLTTVIKNICLTYLRKQSKYYDNEYQLESYEAITPALSMNSILDEVLESLIIRNRQRFQSLEVSIVDEASELIVDTLIRNISKRKAVQQLTIMTGVDKNIAETLYTSSVLYLRSKYMGSVSFASCSDEFSICKDMELIFGKKIGTMISIIFSGMLIKFP